LAKDIIKNIFKEKNKFNDLYPYDPNISNFNLERKHLFYGRIDEQGDIVMMDTNFLVGVESAGSSTNLLLDFVADAFFSLKANFRKSSPILNKNSVYYKDFKVYRSWSTGSLDYNYEQYIKVLYANFVNIYLAIHRRAEKITNFKEFVREFTIYALKTCKNYPVTMSGYISSIHCSPFVSGLMLDIAPDEHGIQNNKQAYKYLNDQHYNLWVKETQKFGFMVDKNAPWRLVFNIASGFKQLQDNPQDPKGAQLFMGRYGVTYENVFRYRYTKVYKMDMMLLQNIMRTLYEAFYRQFSTYEKEEFQLDSTGRCQRVKTTHVRKDREPPPTELGVKQQVDEYWLKLLLKLRMAETGYVHNIQSLETHMDELIEKYRIFGIDSAFYYINELTKGFAVTKFNRKGGYWHGVSVDEYNRRRFEALYAAQSPERVQYSLTGTKNIK
tara:strand:+ start:225 stop:1544 length:1320 start_codon:yes stop_codon:yes gene_type:complete